jgi:anaerobic selenocysteine-containing dehydrogenase
MFRASDAELMDDAVDAADPRMRGLTGSRIAPAEPLAMDVDGEPAMLFRNLRPRTPSGKVELTSGYLGDKYGARVPAYRPVESPYRLALLTPASDQRITSTFGGLRASDATPPLEMHPVDARARGLADGALVRVWNELGEVRLPLRVTDAVRPGVVSSLKGAWLRTSDNGQTISALAPAHHADLAGGACYNDARVEVAGLAR